MFGVPGQALPGDWYCQSCCDLNFARNVVCRRCGAPKPQQSPQQQAPPQLVLPPQNAGDGSGSSSSRPPPREWKTVTISQPVAQPVQVIVQQPGFGKGGGAGAGAPFGGFLDNRAAIYVKELPEGTDIASFRKIIGEYGSIKDCKMVSATTAYVNFSEFAEAEWVVQNLSGNIPEGMNTPVQVSFASVNAGAGGACGSRGGDNRFAPYGGASGGAAPVQGVTVVTTAVGTPVALSVQMVKKMLQAGDALPGGRWTNNDKTVVIKGLPDDTSDEDLYDIFSPFGAIHTEGVRALVWEDGRCKGTAFVNFIDLEGAIKACATLNNFLMPSGQVLKVYRQDADNPHFDKMSGDWTCPACGFLNFARNTQCRKCGAPHPDPSAAASNAQPELKPGDWVCPSCSDVQFARNATCRKCGTANPNPSRPGSFGGPPKVLAGDWNCAACGDLQFARNSHCRKCGSPKPADADAAGLFAAMRSPG